jgi:hypothetical protein
VESYCRQMENLENFRRFRKCDWVAVQAAVSKRCNLQANVINEPNFRNYIMETEEGGWYCRNQKFLKLLPNLNPVTDIEPSKDIPRNTNNPEVKPGLPRQSVQELAPPKWFDDEFAAAEVKHWVKCHGKEKKTVRFFDGPPRCVFLGQQKQLTKWWWIIKSNKKELKTEFECFWKKTSEISERDTKSSKTARIEGFL